MNNIIVCLSGIAIGFINALFGAGGGMIAVPLLRRMSASQKQAQATAICVILPLTVISSAVYLKNGYVRFGQALPFLPLGVVGAVIGTRLLKKLSNSILKKIFALFMLWAGIRMVMR